MSAERFWSFVDRRADGCWEWSGARWSGGYGRPGFKPFRNIPAHRVAWELTNGPIPPGLFVCHHCDHPPCCRPDHLFLGTNSENIRDAVAKNRMETGAEHWANRQPEKWAKVGKASRERGKTATQIEAARELGLRWKGRKQTAAHIAKRAEVLRGRPLPEAVKAKISATKRAKRAEMAQYRVT